MRNEKRVVKFTTRFFLLTTSLIFRRSGHFFRFKDHFLLAGQLIANLGDDQAQVAVMGYVIQIISGDSKDGAKGEILDP